MRIAVGIDEGEVLAPEFYERDPLDVARDLLGAVLVRVAPDGTVRAGRIVETEAYRGEEDQACHARAGRTKRTETMYGPPGRAYVYLIYGMYDMLNTTAWPQGQPAAVLIRAIEPLVGLDGARTHGPGRLTRALGITAREHNGAPLQGPELYILRGRPVAERDVARGPRIGVAYAGEWAQRPWRLWIRDNPFVSR